MKTIPNYDYVKFCQTRQMYYKNYFKAIRKNSVLNLKKFRYSWVNCSRNKL